MDLGWLLPKNILEFSVVLFIALVLDCVYPFHRGVMYRVHPVHTAYFMSLKLYRLLPKTRLAGVAIWLTVVLTHMTIYTILLYLSSIVSRMIWVLVSAYILKVSLSLRLLIDHVYSTYLCIEINDVECARKAIAGAVRRDVSALDKGHIASAAIETLFENIVDGLTSPLFYYLFLGSLGALFQRIVNTLDAALGYKVGDFVRVGLFSARVDDIANYVPARLTMILMIALCRLVGGTPRDSVRLYLRDRDAIESINARTVITSASGCLRVKLEKIGFYTVGDGYDLPGEKELSRSIKLSLYVVSVYIALLHFLALFLSRSIWVSV